MWWLGALGAYLAIAFALCLGTVVSLGLGIENDQTRRQAARFALLTPLWPALLAWAVARGLCIAWCESGWGKQ